MWHWILRERSKYFNHFLICWFQGSCRTEIRPSSHLQTPQEKFCWHSSGLHQIHSPSELKNSQLNIWDCVIRCHCAVPEPSKIHTQSQISDLISCSLANLSTFLNFKMSWQSYVDDQVSWNGFLCSTPVAHNFKTLTQANHPYQSKSWFSCLRPRWWQLLPSPATTATSGHRAPASTSPPTRWRRCSAAGTTQAPWAWAGSPSMGSGLRNCQYTQVCVHVCTYGHSCLDGKCASKYVKVHVLVWQWQSCEREKGNRRSAHLQDHSGETNRESSRYTVQPKIFRRLSLPPTASPLSQSRYFMDIYWRESWLIPYLIYFSALTQLKSWESTWSQLATRRPKNMSQ